MRVLIVEDDPETLDALASTITTQLADATVIPAPDGETGLRYAYTQDPDLVVLDLKLPGKDGFAVLQEIRRGSDVPVVILTGRTGELDEVRGLELGADAYVVKPWSQQVLLSRIRAVMRRAETSPPDHALPDLIVGDLAINLHSHEVRRRGERVRLTAVEYRLLQALARSVDRLLPHRKLLELVWGGESRATLDHLHVYVNRLRLKLEDDPEHPRYIENERGHGYRLARPGSLGAGPLVGEGGGS
jgi:DNA-binding response OmpR family regulator